MGDNAGRGAQRGVAGQLVDWQSRATSFSVLGAYRNPYGLVLSGEGEETRVVVSEFQPAAMGALGVQPLHGRMLKVSDAAGAGDVVLLAHSFWQERFGADPEVLDRRILLNGVPRGPSPARVGTSPGHPDPISCARATSSDFTSAIY